MGDLAAPISQCHLALVAVFLDEAAQVAHLDLVVALVGAWSEFHFLDFDDLLLRLRFRCALLFLVLELAVVHQAAHRRFRRRRDLDEIDVLLFRKPHRFFDLHDANRLTFDSDQAYHGDIGWQPCNSEAICGRWCSTS